MSRKDIDYATKKDNTSVITKIIMVGITSRATKLFIDTLKYSKDTPTHGCTGEIIYPKNILV